MADDASFDTNADVLTSAAQGRLKSLIERIERLEEDKAAVSGDLKEVYNEAKGEGFDTKILRKVVRPAQAGQGQAAGGGGADRPLPLRHRRPLTDCPS